MIKVFQKYKKWILWFLISTFILWGVGTGIASRKPENAKKNYAGKVFGRKISFKEFDKMKNEVQIESYLNDPEQKDKKKESLIDDTWQRLILLGEAKNKKIKISDNEVASAIFSSPAFNKDGKFQKEQYLYFIQNILRITPRNFEECMRHSMQIMKVRMQALESVDIADDKIKEEYTKSLEKAKISYVAFKRDAFNQNITVDEKELLSYYNKNTTEFRIDDQVNIEYLLIPYKTRDFIDSITETDITEYYNTNQEEFVEKDTEGKEITISLSDATVRIKQKLAETKTIDSAQSLAEQIRIHLDIVQDFNEIAEKYSIKTGTTGYFQEKDSFIEEIGFSPVVARSAFSLTYNQVSDPIKSSNGIYIIRLIDKKSSHVPPFADIQDQVKENYIYSIADEKTKTHAQELLDTFLAQLKENKSFTEIAKTLDLTVETTDFFTREGYITGIGFSKDIVVSAFELEQGALSPTLSITPEGYVIFTVDAKQEPTDTEISAGFEEFKKSYVYRQRLNTFFTWMIDLQKRANIEKNF